MFSLISAPSHGTHATLCVSQTEHMRVKMFLLAAFQINIEAYSTVYVFDV